MKKRQQKWDQHKGWKRKKADWKKTYKPTAFDLERDPSLAEQKEAFDWKGYRDFKAKYPTEMNRDDILYRELKNGGT